jgi:DNA ligase 1
VNESQMTLAVDFIGQHSPVGWLASEKLNGCRAYWDGRQFWTRGGSVIAAPKWFTRGLPAIPLDGEIHCGRDGHRGGKSFQVARIAVQHGGCWFEEISPVTGTPIQFAVFDFPALSANWQRRMIEAHRAIKSCVHAAAVRVTRITGPHHFVDYLVRIRKLGGEGGMFRNPETIGYETGRSENLLRFKYVD